MSKQIVLKKLGTKFVCKCNKCGREFILSGFIFRSGQGKFCSPACNYSFKKGKYREWKPNRQQRMNMSKARKHLIGKMATNWKGGRRIDKFGYVLLYAGKSKEVYEHRLIMEKILKRPLKKFESVHHINHNKSDNRPENLALCKNQSEHIKIHNSQKIRDKKGRFVD